MSGGAVRAVDTNVLVRLLARDDARQAESAEAFIAGGAWVSVLALAETIWVLEAAYGLDPPRLAKAVEMLLHHRHLVLQDADMVAAALAQFRRRPAVGFSDCLMVEMARKAGHLPMGTFDKALGRIEGVERL
jgi:predicted nucleic-acid-binding protein